MKRDSQLTIRLPSELHDRLRELAAGDMRTLAGYVVKLLQDHAAATDQDADVDTKAIGVIAPKARRK